MIRAGVVGALGRMGGLVSEAIAAAPDLELVAAVDRIDGEVAGVPVSTDTEVLRAARVVVDFTEPSGVIDNLVRYRDLGVHAVVGTSGFTEARIAELREMWGERVNRCLVVPNFSIGAVLMMRFAEEAAAHFQASEVIELHHDRKADAPSGTAIATAGRMARGRQERAFHSAEVIAGARGGVVEGVPVHSVRLPGLLAHQEVIFGNPGEVLTIRHDSTDRISFVPGVLLAVRRVAALSEPLTVGLDSLL
jgi:4-hydroxy-tetrahydrodipicolinate reductase